MGALDGTEVVVLAGGLGTRLRAAVADRPKVLAPVGGRPFLDRLLDWLETQGARRVILALGHMADQVTAHLAAHPRAGMAVVPSVEPAPLGTGGALRHALPLLRGSPVAVVNGDSFVAADLATLRDLHGRRRARATLTLTRVADAGRYGSVETDADGAITAFREKVADAGPGVVNAGVYLIERDVIAEIPAGRPVSLEREVFAAMCGRGLYGSVQDAPFIDIGTPESWAAAADFFAAVERSAKEG